MEYETFTDVADDLLGGARHLCGVCHGIAGLRWPQWYACFRVLVNHYATREDIAGTFVQRLAQEGAPLWVFWISRV
jgi:hypothetical protein